MSFTVTKPCIGCLDQSCVQVCPVDCFYLAPLFTRNSILGLISAGRDEPSKEAGMLMIHPEECTSCGVCETECPVEAIYEDCSVPEEYQDWVGINIRYTRSLTREQREQLKQHRP